MIPLNSHNRINAFLSTLAFQIKSASNIGRTDINRICEDILVPIFAETHNYKHLENLNQGDKANYPGIDLGDKIAKVAIQVTATSSISKIKKTVQMFLDNGLDAEYSRLIIYILTEKQDRYSGPVISQITQNRILFEPNRDVIDYRDLFRSITSLPIETTSKIERILEENIAFKPTFNSFHMLYRGTTNTFFPILEMQRWWHTRYQFYPQDFKNKRNELLKALMVEAIQGQAEIVGTLYAIPQSFETTLIVGQPIDAQAYDENEIRELPELARNLSFERIWYILRSVLFANDQLK